MSLKIIEEEVLKSYQDNIDKLEAENKRLINDYENLKRFTEDTKNTLKDVIEENQRLRKELSDVVT